MTTATKPRPKKGRGTQTTAPTPAQPTETLTRIAVDSVVPSPYQPRRAFDEAQLAELAASLQASGLLQPISVRTVARGDRIVHELIAGERRLRAAQLAGWADIPAIIRLMDDSEAQALALVENLQRADLSPLEEAQAIKKLMTARKLSQTAVAELLGIPRSTVGDRVGLLEIGPWLELLSAGEITVSQAVELRRLRGASIGVHEAAIEATRSWAGGRPLSTIDIAQFRHCVPHWYSASTYPLEQSPAHWERQPAFDVAAHDDECSCGRVSLDSPPRAFCVNPDWWQPQHDAALAAARETDTSTTGAAQAADTPAREWSDLGVKLSMPQGAEVAVVTYAGVPDGHVLLVGPTGRWFTGQGWDPADVVPMIAADELVAARNPRGGWQIMTTAEDAVEIGRERWHARWEAREEELRAVAAAAGGARPWQVRGPGALQVLLEALDNGDHLLERSIRAVRAHVSPPPDVVEELGLDGDEPLYIEMDDATVAWIRDLRGAHPEVLASEYLRQCLLRREGDPIKVQLQAEQAAAREEISRRPVPWVTTRPALLGEQEELLPDPAGARTVAECVVCGCTDTHACPEGCYWSAINREHHVGVCSSCAETLAAAEQTLAAHLEGER